MKTLITAYLEDAGKGVITVAEARRLGCSPEALRTLVRQGAIIRVARGVYAASALLNPPVAEVARLGRPVTAERKHLLLLDAVLRNYGRAVMASHQSALLAWGLPVPWQTLDRVHVARTEPGGKGRHFKTFTIHTCGLTEVKRTHEGRRLVTPSLAVIGTALTAGLLAGVIGMDAALRAGRATREEIEDLLGRMRHTPRLTAARAALEQADGLAESPGETRLRLILVRMNVEFVAQHWIRTSSGAYYRVDFYLPALGVVLEYDGRVKYEAATRAGPGSDAGAGSDAGRRALTAEKAREDDLRLDGFGVGRVTTGDLTVARITQIALAAAEQAQPKAKGRPADVPPWAQED